MEPLGETSETQGARSKCTEPKAEPKTEELSAELKTEEPSAERDTAEPKEDELKLKKPRPAEPKPDNPKLKKSKSVDPKLNETKTSDPKIKKSKTTEPNSEVNAAAPKSDEIKSKKSKAAESKSDEPKSKKAKSKNQKSSSSEERTRLLDSSNHGYGGIGVSFAERSEIFQTPDFQMNSEDKDSLREEDLKRKLKYFFMNPIDKFYTKRKFPWKLTFQITKIFFVTMQLLWFGIDGYVYELQKQDTETSFRHLLLKDWTALRDVMAYPPSTGPYAVYTKADFFENVDHLIQSYADIRNIAIGAYCYDGPNCTMTHLSFCHSEYVSMVAFNSSITFDSHIRTICHKIPSLYPEGDPRWKVFSIKRYLAQQNDSISFDTLINVDINFNLKTIFFRQFGKNRYPDCYDFGIRVYYNNLQHDGQLNINLTAEGVKIKCGSDGYNDITGKWAYVSRQLVNGVTIFICLVSCLLCVRCLLKANYLCRATDKYFKVNHNKGLCYHEKMEFLDMWYCVIIFNDLLIIAASALKAAIEQRSVESDQYTTCAILLGAGNFLVWAGILRYLMFFSKYNILILTMKRAIPNVLRFTLCCVLLYAGFVLCGWLVLGPYHIKFRSLSSTSECLFAMMNGDDLFATFAITNTRLKMVWWFSRIYLYTFISMFIYVVISLFISVIMDSYETVKDYHRRGTVMSRVEVFIEDYPDDSCSSFYRQRRRLQLSLFQWIANQIRR